MWNLDIIWLRVILIDHNSIFISTLDSIIHYCLLRFQSHFIIHSDIFYAEPNILPYCSSLSQWYCFWLFEPFSLALSSCCREASFWRLVFGQTSRLGQSNVGQTTQSQSLERTRKAILPPTGAHQPHRRYDHPRHWWVESAACLHNKLVFFPDQELLPVEERLCFREAKRLILDGQSLVPVPDAAETTCCAERPTGLPEQSCPLGEEEELPSQSLNLRITPLNRTGLPHRKLVSSTESAVERITPGADIPGLLGQEGKEVRRKVGLSNLPAAQRNLQDAGRQVRPLPLSVLLVAVSPREEGVSLLSRKSQGQANIRRKSQMTLFLFHLDTH